MNEAAKEYYSEVASRSITAKSAHAKNGQNSEKLGSRQLTRKEIEEKHGPVKTYTFDDFLTFAEFREMPTDWQAAYINNLQDKYDIGLMQINRDLFGARDDNQLRSHLKLKGILNDCHPERKRGRTRLHEFRRDIREYRMRPATPEKKAEPVEKPLPKFMEREDFKALGRVQQQIFTKRLLDEYGLGLKTINAELFNSNSNSFREYLVSHGFDMAKDFGIKRGGNKSGEQHDENLSRFRRDIAEWRKGKVCSEVANAVGLPEDILKNATKPASRTSEAINDVAEATTIIADKMREAFKPITEVMVNPCDPEDVIHEAVKQLNEKLEKEGELRVNDFNQALGMKPVPEELNSVTHVKPVVFKTKQKVFSTCYIGIDFNMAEIEALRKMFAGQKIQVEITVTTDSIIDKYE